MPETFQSLTVLPSIVFGVITQPVDWFEYDREILLRIFQNPIQQTNEFHLLYNAEV